MLPRSCSIPIPSRPVYPAGRDGTGRDRDRIFKMGRDCASAGSSSAAETFVVTSGIFPSSWSVFECQKPQKLLGWSDFCKNGSNHRSAYMVVPQAIDPNRAAAQIWSQPYHTHFVYFLGRVMLPYQKLSRSDQRSKMIIMVRDGMGLISYLLLIVSVDYGWSYQ